MNQPQYVNLASTMHHLVESMPKDDSLLPCQTSVNAYMAKNSRPIAERWIVMTLD